MKICKTCKYARNIWFAGSGWPEENYHCTNINYKKHIVQCNYEAGTEKDINWDQIKKRPFSTTKVTDRCVFYKEGEPT